MKEWLVYTNALLEKIHIEEKQHHYQIRIVLTGRQVSYFFLLFPTFWGLSYFFLLLGKIPTFSYFFRFLLKLIDKNAIFKQKKIFLSCFTWHTFLL